MLALEQLDIDKGELYRFALSHEKFIASFVKSKSDGKLVFKRQDTGTRREFSRLDFKRMRGVGKIARWRASPDGSEPPPGIEPDAFDPPARGDSKTVAARKQKYLRAVTQRYYVICIDEGGISRSIDAIREFIEQNKQNHEQFGLSKAPGASTLIKLCREVGWPGYRPLHIFLSGAGGDRRSKLWDQFILERKAAMIELFYSYSEPEVTDSFAISWIRGEIAKESERRKAAGEGTLEPPPRSTLKRWLGMAGTDENRQRKYGRTIVNRQSGGVVPHLTAFRPLESVVMDHTQIDLHLVTLDEYGEIRDSTLRPWLILVVDVYSRMILAANLTWEHPSLYTLMEGLRQTVRPKDFLEHLAASSALAYACDGYGKFGRMLVDNDLANVGQSMRMTAFSVGLDVSFAAVRNPETKSIVERAFGTLNTQIWHQAHGGVRPRPGRLKDEDPSKAARFTLEEAQEMLWEWIVTVYHVDVHEGIQMAPARRWKEAYKYFRRPLIDDVEQIEEAFNRTEERQLTRTGIRIGKERFHDPDITSELILDLFFMNRRRLDRNRSVSIPVRVRKVLDGDTVAEIRVYNYARKIWVALPNVDRYKTGCFAEQKIKRMENNIANEEFYPRSQVDINRAKILTKIAPHPLATAYGMGDELDSPHQLAIHSAETPMIARKAAQRGVSARRRNVKEAKEKAARIETRKAERSVEAGKDLNFDPAEALENTLSTAQEDALTELEMLDLGAQVRKMLNLDRS
ncbi:transposase family protein [Rhizobium leguminosarum]|uniref:hypothetical protein n=1 Tax=Rhizobium leguminosarum TaxID=384 RepID=UPI001C949F1F|nr:hypothetical protein [Rhizobium leguminosarum]MBY5545996.1 transposase family protein [Rhizobium leguminosarum]